MSETLDQEIARNRRTRERNRDHARHMARRQRSALFRAARWGIVPLREGYALWREKLTFEPQRKKLIEAYVQRTEFRGLHIGCGPNRIDGWLNTDVLPHRLPWSKADSCESAWDFPLDITRPLPFPDASLDAIFGEEVIEHVPRDDALAFMAEARRVLRPDGVLRLTTPDLDNICRLFLGEAGDLDVEALEPFWLEAEWSREHWINAMFRAWGHQFIWNAAQLTEAMRGAGFPVATRVQRGETASAHPRMASIACRAGPKGAAAAVDEHAKLIVEGIL